VPPSTPTEEQLARVWAEVLSIEQPGVEDNFFVLGGHSLLGVKLLSRIRDTFGVELPLGELFASPTIRTLARLIEQQSPPSEPIQPQRIQAAARGTKTIEEMLAEIKGRSEATS
jgi:acyl carrier protein